MPCTTILFKNVTVDEFQFNRTFQQSEVLYWELNSVDMKRLCERHLPVL